MDIRRLMLAREIMADTPKDIADRILTEYTQIPPACKCGIRYHIAREYWFCDCRNPSQGYFVSKLVDGRWRGVSGCICGGRSSDMMASLYRDGKRIYDDYQYAIYLFEALLVRLIDMYGCNCCRQKAIRSFTWAYDDIAEY